MCASSSPADPMSPSTSPRSCNRSRRNSAAREGESRTSPRRASRTSTRPAPPPSGSNGPSARNLGSRADDMDLGAWRRRIREYDEITNVGPIIRRYFVIGAFDGALTVLGIIIGAYAVGASETHKALILSASIGAAVALAVSSAVGAYEAERVEKKLDIRTIERAMLARLAEDRGELEGLLVFLTESREHRSLDCADVELLLDPLRLVGADGTADGEGDRGADRRRE